MRAFSLLIKVVAPAILLFAQAKPDPRLVLSGEISVSNVSQDGKYLAFTNWTNGELYIRELASGTDRQLTHKAATDAGQSPSGAFVSADSQLVAYEWNTPTAKEIRVVPLGGGQPRRVQATGAAKWLQGWHPNGEELLVVSANGLEATGDLGFLSIETGAFRRIAALPGAAHARLSPDASQIVFSALSARDPTQSDIGLIDCATGRTHVLLSGPSDDYSPEWVPASNSIVFISDRGRRPQLWTLRLSAGVPRPEPAADLVDGDLSIARVTREGIVIVDAEDIGGTDSYTATVDWTTGRLGKVELLPNPLYKGSRRPVPSPDGRRVAFLRRSRGYRVRPGWQIPVVQELEGSKAGRQRVYPTALTLRDAPGWFPNGGSLVFTMPPAGAVGDSAGREWRFVRLDLTTGKYDELGSTGIRGFVRLAGLTGQHLYYVLDSSRIMAFNLKSHASREIFRLPAGPALITDAAVLGDAERVALAIGGSGRAAGIAVVTLPATEMIEIEKVEANTRPQLVWCSDRKSILVSGRVGSKQGIWRIAADGGERQRLTLDESGITEVRLSENGARIAFTRRLARPREVWAYSLRSGGTKAKQ